MKKFLVLTLVLGIASLASATLTLSLEGDVSVGGTFYLVVSGTAPGDFGSYEIYDRVEAYGVSETDVADFTGTVIFGDNGNGFPAGGNLTGWDDYTGIGYDGGLLDFGDLDDGTEGDAALNDPVSGLWAKIQMVGKANGTMTIVRETNADYSDYEEVFGTVTIPEPATMALLGLGALVLRRRK